VWNTKIFLLLSLLLLGIVSEAFPVQAVVSLIPSTNIAPIDSNTEIDSGLTMGINGAYPASLSEGGLCFVSTTTNLRQVKFNMIVPSGSPFGTFNAQLFASSGTFGTSCQPTASALATSNPVIIGSISGDTPFFIFDSYIDLQAQTIYAVSIRLVSCVKCDSSNYWYLQYTQTDFSITSNIYYWNNPYAVGLQHSKLKYEIDGSPIVQLKTKFGSLDVRNQQQTNNFAVYANGTIMFNVTGLELQQGKYIFNAVSYGNGTFIVKFVGGSPFTVTTFGTASYLGSFEQISYSSVTSGPLVVNFSFVPCIPLFNLLPIFAVALLAVPLVTTLYARKELSRNARVAITAVILTAIVIIIWFSAIPAIANLVAGASVC